MGTKSETGLLEYIFHRKHLIIVDVDESDLFEAEEIFNKYHGKRALKEVEESGDMPRRGEKITLCYIVDSERISDIREDLYEDGIISKIANALPKPYSLRSKLSSCLF